METSLKIAAASYSFHGLKYAGKMDVFGYLESCRYRYHLLSADIWDGFFPTVEQDFLAKVKEALVERDLELANLCMDGAHIWEDDPAEREAHHQRALTYLRAAEFLDARTIRIDAGGQGDVFTDEQFDLIVERYKQYAQIAYDHGFKVGPENHWGPEVVPATMRRICEAVDHPGFGVLLHFRGGEGDAVIAPWAMHTHISWDITENCLEDCLEVLRQSGYSGYYSVEHHSGKNEYAEVAVQVAKVRALLSRWAELHTQRTGPDGNPMIPA